MITAFIFCGWTKWLDFNRPPEANPSPSLMVLHIFCPVCQCVHEQLCQARCKLMWIKNFLLHVDFSVWPDRASDCSLEDSSVVSTLMCEDLFSHSESQATVYPISHDFMFVWPVQASQRALGLSPLPRDGLASQLWAKSVFCSVVALAELAGKGFAMWLYCTSIDPPASGLMLIRQAIGRKGLHCWEDFPGMH